MAMPSEQAFDEAGDTGEFPAGESTTTAPRARHTKPEFAGVSHPGKVRANNEDRFLVARLAKSMRVLDTNVPGDEKTRFSEEEGYLAVVADGMGGAAAGEVASTVAVQTVERFVLNAFKWFLHLGHKEEHTLVAELRQALERADREVIRRATADPSLAGMGTTLTMAYSVGTDLYLVHAGDTRAYLLRGGELHLVTTDHTLVQMLVEGGQITPEQAKHHKRRHVVTNVLGGPSAGVQAEIHKIEIEDGDVLLLCSDGLSEPVEDAALERALLEAADPEAACQALLELALAGGGPDNITAVVTRYRVS